MHKTRKVIYKNILLDNVNIIRNCLDSKQKLCIMVKANAYGHGVETICKLLKEKVDYFGVANINEALEIRNFDNDSNILIVGITDEYGKCVENNISFTIDNIESFYKLKNYVEKHIPLQKPRIHLKINTGMNRLGISTICELKSILKLCEKYKFNIEGVFTHFASIDTNKYYAEYQNKKFQSFIKIIHEKFNPIVHVGGSSVLKTYSELYDMVRVGLIVYGYSNKIESIKPVMNIYSDVVSVNTAKKGDFLGYDCVYICKKDTKYAVLPVGYADGFLRNISNNFIVKKSKKEYRQIGNICMDMMMINISSENEIGCGDEFLVMDNAKYIAETANVSVYEVLTGFSKLRGEVIVK